MSANRQLKRHHACHECRTKKLKCSGDRPVCDGCKRKQDHHTASGSRRPVPECTYDFPPGEEVWVHYNGSNARLTTGRPVGKRTPSPPNDYKPRRPRTPTKPPMEEIRSEIARERPIKPHEPRLSAAGLPESPPYPDSFSTHFSPYGSLLSGLPYTYNAPVSLNGFPHNTALAMEQTSVQTMNEHFFAVGSHSQYPQVPESMVSSDSTTNEFAYPTTSYPNSLPSVALLSNGILRWM